MRKLLFFFFALLASVSGAWATTYTITYGTTTGTFYRSGSASTDWSSKWVSNEAGKPVVTVATSVNNMNGANARIAPQTYTIYAEAGYKVTGFAMNCPTFGATVTVTPAGESAVEVAENGTLVVNSSASSFVFAGGSNQARIQAGSNDGGTFTITVEEEDWIPSIAGAFLTVGDKVESITAATAADDNAHWYILTQVRNAETPMYNTGVVGETLKRASSPFTLSSLDGALTSTNSAYLIRFKSVGEGTYNIQFANGYWIDGSLKAANFNTAGTYAFYNCNSGSGSYFAWNLNSKSGSRVDNNGAGNGLAFWGSGEVSGTSGNNVWYIYETEVYVPASTIEVTYAQYVDGEATGTTVVETVLPNSAINVPSSLYTGYSSLAYDYSTTGTIAEEDVTIRVNINKKSGVTQPAGLSNSKKYQLICGRGGLSTYYDEANSRTALASPVKTGLGVSAKEFAILNYDGKYYLYSVSDSKFVTYQETQIAPLANLVTGTSDAIAFSQTTNSVFVIRFDNDANKNINSSATYTYGIAINDWGSYESDWDDGCQYIIKEVGDFDATTPLAALEYSLAIAQLKAINWGLTASGNKGKPNYYNFIGTYAGYAGNEMNSIKSLESAGYSTENLATAQDILANGYALNMPAAGFYRVKGKTNNKYLAAGNASNGKYNMSEATDNTTLFYFNGSKLMNVSSGLSNGMTTTSWQWVTEAAASTVSFEDGQRNGGYLLHSANAYFFDNGTSADRGTSYDNRDNYRNWYLEPFDGPLAITIGDAKYATLYAPVALTIPANVQAYYVSVLTETEATLTEVSTTIAANTPVILKAAAAGAYNFAFTTGGTDVSASNQLSGSVGGVAVADDEAYTLQQNEAGDAVGLFPKAAGTIAGFKAYLSADKLPAGVRGLAFTFEGADGINTIEENTVDNGAIFNLSGQRVQKAQKGLYIVNGKKFIIK